MEFPDQRNSRNGFGPLYVMYQTFLNDVIQTYTIGDLIEDENVESLEYFTTGFRENWTDWLPHVILFLLVIILGVFLAVCLPLCACCCVTCKICCRCSCKCESCDPSSPSSSKRCFFTLLTLATVVLATMFSLTVCAFVLNQQIKDELTWDIASADVTQNDDTSLFADVTRGLHDVNSFAYNVGDEIDESLGGRSDEAFDDVMTLVEYAPEYIVRAIEVTSGVYPSLYELYNYTIQSLPQLSLDLETMTNTSSHLVILTATLNSELKVVQDNLRPVLTTGCTSSGVDTGGMCEDLFIRSLFLESAADYTAVDDVTSAQNVIDSAIASGELNSLMIGAKAWDNTTAQLKIDIEQSLVGVDDDIQNAQKEVDDVIEEAEETLKNVSLFDDAIEWSIQTQEVYVDVYAKYFHAVTSTLTSLQLVIVVVYVSGAILAFSRFSKHGRRTLRAGNIMSIICGFFFFLATALLFAVGGGIEVAVCRHLVTYDASAQQLGQLFQAEVDLDYVINVRDALDSCRDNASLYEALQVDKNDLELINNFNLSHIFDDSLVSNLFINSSFQLDDVTFMTVQTETALMQIEAETDAINFESRSTCQSPWLTLTSFVMTFKSWPTCWLRKVSQD